MPDAGDGLSAVKRELLAKLLGGAAPAPARRIPSAPGGRTVRLSLPQERVWLTSQLAGDVPAFNIGAAIRLPFEVHEAILRQHLGDIAGRHDSLRMSVRPDDQGQPMMSIAPEVPIDLRVLDLSQAGDQDTAIIEAIREVTLEPYRLDQAPLWRIGLLRLAPEDSILLVAAHHVICDASSLMHIVKELASPDWRPTLPVAYRDFAAWQRDQITSGAYDEQMAFWRRELPVAPVPLELPTDRPRPAEPDYAGVTLQRFLPPTVGEEIRALARAEDTTAYTVVLAALKVLLARYTGQPDITVGVQVAGRNLPELQHLIGMFVNVVPVRTEVAAEVTFREVLRRVRRQLTAALAHQDVPFEQLVQVMRAGTDRSIPPLVQVACNMPMQEANYPVGEEVPLPIALGGSLLDLTVHAVPQSDGRLEIQFEYATALFDETTIERMSRHYRRLLTLVAADPDLPLSRLELLDAEERAGLLRRGTGVHHGDGVETLPELVARQAAATPYAVAVESGARRMSYAELLAGADVLARRLRAAGVGPGQIVALCLDRGVELSVAALGVWRAGAAFLPLDPEHPSARWSSLLERSAAVVALTDGARLAELTGVRPAACQVFDVAGLLTDGPAVSEMPAAPATPARLADAAYVMFTSGSTGQPKGVVVTHGGIANRVCWSVGTQKVTADDRLLAKTRVGFDAAVLEWFAPLVAGGTVVMAPAGVERDPAELVRALGASRATILQLVPSVLRVLLDQPGWSDCGALRQVWSAGEPLDSALVRRLREKVPATVWNTYGPTECAIDVTAQPAPADQATGPISIGGPIDGVRVLLLDAHGRLVPDGVAGELCVGGVAVARGYLGQPDLTAERFVPDPYGPPGARLYRTGDQARWHAGTLEFIGRADDQVKINGVRVEPAEVGAVLADHPEIRQVLVVGHRGADGTRRLVAYLVADRQLTGDELRDFARTRLPEAMIPTIFVPLDALPLTDNGKVDRAALPAPGATIDSAARVAPRTPAERLVAEVWAELLGVSQVSADDDFFALGGHSLLLGQLAVKLRERSGVEVSIRDLFANLSVPRQAALIEPDRAQGPPPVTPVGRDGPLPASFGQRRLWFLDRLNPNSIEYLTPLFLALPGPVRAEDVQRALVDLVTRHEALRTRYLLHDGEPQQVIDPPGPVALRVLDVPGRPSVEDFADELARGFDLAAGPVLRALLVRPVEGEAILLIVMHHIACDGWSTGVLGRDFKEFYAGRRDGREVALAPLPVQYADFAVWQRAWLSGELLDRQLAYWSEQLAGLPSLNLPTDRVRPALRDPSGGLVTFQVPQAQAQAILAAGRARGASPFMTLLAAFAVLLAHYSGQRDFAIGAPIAGRPRPELSGLVGIFINNLVLRCDLSGEPTFGELIDRVRSTTLSAFAHQDMPFERLVEAVQAERDMSRNPLYDALFDLQEEENAGFIPDEPVEDAPLASRQDLGLTLRRQADGSLVGMLEFATTLFNRGTAERMVGHFLRLLAQIAADADAPVCQLDLLTPTERRLLAEWSDTGHDVPISTLPELLHRQVSQTPQATALVSADVRLSYAELDERASRLARLLAIRRVGPEETVAVALPRSVDLVVALLAVGKAGAAYLPIDPEDPAERINHLLDDAGAELLLTCAEVATALPETGVRRLVLDDPATVVELGQVPGGTMLTWVQPANPASVIYTSGSTGQPVAAVLTHSGVVNRLLWMQGRYGLTADDRVLQKTPATFDVSVWELFWPLLAGATLVLAEPGRHRDPAYLAKVIEDERITTVHFPPSTLDTFLAEPQAARCTSLRRVFCSDEALAPALRDRFFTVLGAELHNLYGPTEASVGVTAWWCRPEHQGEPVPIGHPVWNTALRVLDGQLRPVPPGIPGDLYLAGVQLARGYLKRPALTAERFVPDPYGPPGSRMYRTGDLARWRVDGAVTLDRIPVTAQGKLDEVPEDADVEGTRPRTLAEERIAELWTDLLGVEVGVDQNFFRVGGHSLLAVRLNSLIQEEFDVELPLRVIFEQPTIAELAQAVEAAIRAEVASLSEEEVVRLATEADQMPRSTGLDGSPTTPDPLMQPPQGKRL